MSNSTYLDPTERFQQDIICTVDALLFTMTPEGELSVLLNKRKHSPFQGMMALPGVYIMPEADVSVEAASLRALLKKTGVVPNYLEQLKTFSGAERDPRGWSISIAHFGLMPWKTIEFAADSFCAVKDVPQLAFDHNHILETAIKRIRDKSSYSSLPLNLIDRFVKLSEIKNVYETLIGKKFPRTSFRNWINHALKANVIRETGAKSSASQGRPSTIYENMLYGMPSENLFYLPSITD
jgi:ADP-ribose pyrophosphatase YjhB (NUDIX family)